MKKKRKTNGTLSTISYLRAYLEVDSAVRPIEDDIKDLMKKLKRIKPEVRF